MTALEENETNKYTLVGVDPHPFCITAYVGHAMREVGYPKETIVAYLAEALCGGGGYDHFLHVSMRVIDEINTTRRHA